MIHCVIASSSELSWWVSWKIQQTRAGGCCWGLEEKWRIVFFLSRICSPGDQNVVFCCWKNRIHGKSVQVSVGTVFLWSFTIPVLFSCSLACLNLPVVICSCSNYVIQHAVKYSQMLVANFLKSRKKKLIFSLFFICTSETCGSDY